MFGLIKLAAYSLLGYALYEFFHGLTNPRPSKLRRHPLAQGVRRSIEGEIQSRHGSAGSPENGRIVGTRSGDGGTATHVVGRGVVAR